MLVSHIPLIHKLKMMYFKMSVAAKASLRFSRRMAPTCAHVCIPNVGELANANSIHTKRNNSNNNRHQFYHCYHRHHAVDEIEALPSTSTLRKTVFRRQLSTTTAPTITDKNTRETPLMERTEKNIIQRMYDKYSISRQNNRILMAESLLQSAISQASDPRWNIGQGFRSYHALLTMHIWFLHKRLVGNQDDPYMAALIQEELFDIFWIDTSNRMRAHGVTEMLIAKNLKKVQQYTFMHMFHYDHCYTGDLLGNPLDRLDELKNLVKTHILLLPPLPQEDDDNIGATDKNEGDDIRRKHIIHDDQAERIAWYVETQFQNIVIDLPESFFQKARIAWVDLPSFDGMAHSKELPKTPNDTLPPGWLKNIANDGTYYYWNVKTREAQWDRP